MKKNRQKELLRVLARSGALDLSAMTPEQLCPLGLDEMDLKDLREKELALR